MARSYAIHICGLGPLVPESCPKGGPDHEPFPTGYASWHEYALLLLSHGWKAHLCHGCGLWAIWSHPSETERPAWPPANDDHLDYEPPADPDAEDDA